MSVPLKEIQFVPGSWDTFLAVDTNGLVWFGKLSSAEDGRPVIDWEPVKGPPDGQQFSEGQKSFWDKMEQRLREAAKHSPNPDGTPLSLAEKVEPVAAATGGTVGSPPDDSLQDGEGDDTSH